MQRTVRTGRLQKTRRINIRSIRWTLYGAGILLVLVILAQIFYPTNRLLPFTEIGNNRFGGQAVNAAAKELEKKFEKARISVKTDKKTFAVSLQEIGIDIASLSSAKNAATYSFWQRIIPFSSLYIMANRQAPIMVEFDDDRLKYFAEQVQKEGFVPAVNASIAVTDGKVVLVPAQPSKEYPVEVVASAIKDAEFTLATNVSLTPKTAPAERTNTEVKEALKDAQRAVNTPLKLKVDAESITLDKQTIGSWLVFTEDPATKKLQVGLQHDVVTKYLQKIQSKIYKAPGTTRVQLIDGREVSRQTGETGRGIDIGNTIALLDTVLKKGKQDTVMVPIAAIPARTVFDKQYSNTDAGLSAMLTDLAGSKGFGVSIMELGGRSANINGNKRFTAASTYKLYVAYAVFKQIEAGKMQWSDQITSGRTAEACFDVMIVRSDNPCAKAFGDKIGWGAVEDMMRGLGLTSTSLSSSFLTTSSDLALFLYKLENGSLLSASDKGRLVEAMKRQIYRAGIPAGTGALVANKPGFIESYIHDAAIVYGPRGPYALIIMTSGSSWGAIADTAKQIHTFLNR